MHRRALSILAFALLIVTSSLALSNPPAKPQSASAAAFVTFLPLIQKPAPWTTILNESFDDTPAAGWTVAYGKYVENAYAKTWGVSSCNSYSGSHSAWALGTNFSDGVPVPYTSCYSGYQTRMDAWMIYGPFSLDGAQWADVTFRYWLNAAAGDFLSVAASKDNLSYYGLSTGGVTNGWDQAALDLNHPSSTGPSMLGDDSVWIAFVFTTDDSHVAMDGAFIDDVVIRNCSTNACLNTRSSSIGALDADGTWEPATLTQP